MVYVYEERIFNQLNINAMKRNYLSIFLALSAIAACEKVPVEPGTVYPEPESNVSYLLEGTVATEGFAWKTSSAVGLYSAMDEIKIINKECRIVGWANTAPVIDEETGENTNAYTPSEYEGKAVARFTTPALDLVAGENKFVVYSPYNPDLVYSRGIIYGLNIDDRQVQAAPNVAADCFALGMVTGIPGVDETFKFELNPVTAVAQVSISSTEFAGYAPKRVSIYDDNNTPMAGGFNLNPETMEIVPTGEPLNRVSVTVTNTSLLSEVKTQNIYMNILPVDMSGKEIWVIVELQNEEGLTITVPTKKSGLVFKAGQTTLIDLGGLSETMNAAGEWYVATETRYLPGPGVAYGEANTYFIQCKNGSTYTGASYTPNPDIPDEIKIDIRARGNFYNAVDPKGAEFDWARTMNGTVYTCRTIGYEASGVDPANGYEFSYDGNYTVTVKNVSAYAGSPILVMKKDGKILWAWTFWNVAADGTSIKPVTTAGYDFAPMDIGQATTQFDTWVANKNGANPDVVYRTTNLYQWGRYMPNFWTSYWTVTGGHDGANAVTNEQCLAILTNPLSYTDAMANPVGMILAVTDATDQANWCSDDVKDFWGSTTGDREKEGIKSIYDPCPKGWRVADTKALSAIVDACPEVGSGYSYIDTAGYPGIRIGDNSFICAGYINGKTSDNGRLANMGGANTGNTSGASHGLLWSNVCGAVQGQAFYFRPSSGKVAPKINSYNKSISAPVRCQVDRDNR